MTRILNIITDSNIGGAGNVLINFFCKTNRKEFDHTVIVPEKSLLTPRLKELGVNVVEMADIGEKSYSRKAVGEFRRIISMHRPDVVHTHASLSARIAAKRWGKCAIVHTRHCTYQLSKLKTSFPVKNVLGFMNNRYSDIIIAISPAARDNLVDMGTDPKKIITMFNGVEPIRRLSIDEKKAVRSNMGIKDDEFVCMIAARLVHEKGHQSILDAAEMLRSLPIRFILAGSGPIESELRAAVDSRKLDNCIITGFVADIAALENITDLNLNASYGTETSSLSILEGYSLGIPAVASDFGGNPYLVTDGVDGLIFPRQDACALADAIRKLFENPETLTDMSKAALETYKTRFTSEILASNIEQVYRDAIKLKKREV